MENQTPKTPIPPHEDDWFFKLTKGAKEFFSNIKTFTRDLFKAHWSLALIFVVFLIAVMFWVVAAPIVLITNFLSSLSNGTLDQYIVGVLIPVVVVFVFSLLALIGIIVLLKALAKRIAGKDPAKREEIFNAGTSMESNSGLIIGSILRSGNIITGKKKSETLTIKHGHSWVIGQSGSGKTSTVLLTSLLSNLYRGNNDTVFITDPLKSKGHKKGEIFTALEPHLKKLEKEYIFFNTTLDNSTGKLEKGSASFNPFELLQEIITKDITAGQNILDSIAYSLFPEPPNKSNETWSTTPRDLLKGIIYSLLFKNEPITFKRINEERYNTTPTDKNGEVNLKLRLFIETTLNKISEDNQHTFKQLDWKRKTFLDNALVSLKNGWNNIPKQNENFLGSWGDSINPWIENQALQRITEKSSFKIIDLIKKPYFVFYQFTAGTPSDNKFSSLFIELLYTGLQAYRDIATRNVSFWLEEFSNLAYIPSIKNMITLSRSGGYQFIMCTQDIATIKKTYGEQLFKTLWENAQNRIILRTSGETADLIISTAGTRESTKHSTTTGHDGKTSTTTSTAKENIFKKSELRSLETGQAFILLSELEQPTKFQYPFWDTVQYDKNEE